MPDDFLKQKPRCSTIFKVTSLTYNRTFVPFVFCFFISYPVSRRNILRSDLLPETYPENMSLVTKKETPLCLFRSPVPVFLIR